MIAYDRRIRNRTRPAGLARLGLLLLCAGLLASCSGTGSNASGASSVGNAPPSTPAPQADQAPPAVATGGFDGQQAYQYTADLVAIGERTAGTPGGQKAQQYIINKLQDFGCAVDQQDFDASTPIGTVHMKNIVGKALGASPDLLLFTTHYDTKMLPNFVGADDGGSSTGLMLEFARQVCKRKNALTVWIVFFDGEEAFNPEWKDPDNTYGSREMAARMALSGELPHIKALILADMIGERNLQIKRETYSTSWLTDLVWSTARRLGYGNVFLSDEGAIEDDHQSFLRRNVPSLDIIDLEVPYWHTPQDTMDKVSPRSLAIVGHVLMATLPELEQRFSKK